MYTQERSFLELRDKKAAETGKHDLISDAFREKSWSKGGGIWKLVNGNLNLNRVSRPKGEALMPCNDSRAQVQEERLLFFPGRDLANEKLYILFAEVLSTSSYFP